MEFYFESHFAGDTGRSMKNIPLFIRLIAALVFIITILLSLFGGIVGYKYKEAELAKLHRELALEVKKLQISLGGALWSYDVEQVNHVLQAFMRDPRISGIVVNFEELRMVVARDGDGRVVNDMTVDQLDREIRLDAQIAVENTSLGEIELYATSRHLSAQLLTLLKIFLLSILLLDLFLIITLYYMVNRMMISPLMTLKNFIISTRTGSADRSMLNRVRFRGELEVLRSSMVEIINELDYRYKALQESETGFRTLLGTIPDLVWLKDINGTYLTCNKAFERFLGKSVNEIIGRTDYDLFDHELADWFRSYDKLAMDKGEPVINEEWVPFSGQIDEMLLETTKTPMYSDKGDLVGVLGVAHDITVRKQNEEERIALQGEVSRMQKFEAIGRLAGGISHDFNNMLSVILGHTELILEQLPQDSSLREDLHEILEASKRSTELTRQLLAFARKQKRAPEIIDVNSLISNMTRMLIRLIGEDVSINWLPRDDLWQVKMDPSQLDQILVNLCVNARDAIDGNGSILLATDNITVTDEVKFTAAEAIEGDFVKLTVTDNGCGMSVSVLEKIFDPFFTTKDFSSGTGLGLSTVYGIVKQNNGFIDVKSEQDAGTTFDIYLPRSVEIEVHEELDSPQAEKRKQNCGILVVEDEPSMLSFITRSLTRQNYTVLAANNPIEALSVAENNRDIIDLVLTDIIMPEMNGGELVIKLEEVLPGVKHIYMSGYAHDVLRKIHIDESDENFIQKPFLASELVQLIRKIVS